MLKEKVIVNIKTNENSAQNLNSVVMNCRHCREMLTGNIPDCVKGAPCKLETYIAARVPNTVSAKHGSTVTEVIIPVKSVSEAERAFNVAKRAIKLRTHQIYRTSK